MKHKLEDNTQDGTDSPPPAKLRQRAESIVSETVGSHLAKFSSRSQITDFSSLNPEITYEDFCNNWPDDDQTFFDDVTDQEEGQEGVEELKGITRDTDPTPQADLNEWVSSEDVTDVDQGKVACVRDAPIGTNGAGPCIAVGKTGIYEEHRYSALTHWDGLEPTNDAGQLFNLLDEAIHAEMNGQNGQLEQVKYLIIGGQPSSKENQDELLKEIKSRSLKVSIHLVPHDHPNADTADSAAFIDKDGNFFYHTVYEKDQ